MPHRPPLTRRDAMRLSAGALLSAGLWPGALAAEGEKDSGDFHFSAGNDMHWKEEKGADWFARLAKQMNGHAEKPEVVLRAADLADDGTPPQLGPTRDWCKNRGPP